MYSDAAPVEIVSNLRRAEGFERELPLPGSRSPAEQSRSQRRSRRKMTGVFRQLIRIIPPTNPTADKDRTHLEPRLETDDAGIEFAESQGSISFLFPSTQQFAILG